MDNAALAWHQTVDVNLFGASSLAKTYFALTLIFIKTPFFLTHSEEKMLHIFLLTQMGTNYKFS